MSVISKGLLVVIAALLVMVGVQTVRLHFAKLEHERLVHGLKLAESKAKEEALAQSEANREFEREMNRANQKVTNDLQAREARRDRALASLSRRLRDAESSYRIALGEAAAAAAARRRDSGAPAVALIPDKTRDDLVRLARDADQVADRLRACQAYITEVIEPLQWNQDKTPN